MSNKQHASLRGGLAVLAAAALVAGCGGDDFRNAPGPTEQVPASASQSPAGFIDYLKQLVASSADPLEPVDTSAVTPQVDDTGEPVAVP